MRALLYLARRMPSSQSSMAFVGPAYGAAPCSTALAVRRIANILPYNVRLSLCGSQDRYRPHFDAISYHSAGHSGPQDR